MKLLIALHWDFLSDALVNIFDQYEIYTCKYGSSALSLLDSLCPDILIIGLCLTGMDGISVLRNAKHKPRAVIAITNFVSLDICQDAAECGVQRIIRIPCTAAHVKEQLDQLLNENPSPV